VSGDTKHIERLRSQLEYNAAMVAESNRLLRASLKQWFTVDDLRERWALGRDHVIALLREKEAYRPAVGKPIRVPLAVVLVIDEELNRG
jgi:hypothetical protein